MLTSNRSNLSLTRSQSLQVTFAIACLLSSLWWWLPGPTQTKAQSLRQFSLAGSIKQPKPKAIDKPKPKQRSQPQPSPKTIKRSTSTKTDIFEGGSDSIVTYSVGATEGTRTPTGGKNRAYWGHWDPGNGVWNKGSFSYQHCPTCTPEEADRRQLARLKVQDRQLQAQAKRKGLVLTLEERLNGIDLANQAPLAALDIGGYIDRLAQVKRKGITGDRAILEARVWSYWSPYSNYWAAPGLGNNEADITHDQNRRMGMIREAIAVARRKGLVSHIPLSKPFLSWVLLLEEQNTESGG